MEKPGKKGLALILIFLASLFVTQTASAMHIMEGYLPPVYCVLWGIVCIPFLGVGVVKIRRTIKDHRKSLLLLAMAGAFVFVISSLKLPSVTASCSHMTGTGLSAILFGPTYSAVLGLIVLIFQALLLAHGGITSLGANTFSMAIAGPLAAWGIYRLCKKLRVNRLAAIFLSATLGDLITYCVTALQLAVAYPEENGGILKSAVYFLGVFAPTQLPLAIVEGLLTVVVVIGLESLAKQELTEIGFLKEGMS